MPKRRIRTVGTVFLCAGLLASTACANQKTTAAKRLVKLAQSFSPDTKTKLAKEKNEDRSQSRYLSVQARKKEDNAEVGVDIPYDLHGNFRVEMTFGVFSDKKAENLGDGSFGLEIRNAGNAAEFYAVYARYQPEPEGLLVRAESHQGQHGSETFFPVTRADAAAESDGESITLYARAAGEDGEYLALATVPVASPSDAHAPGFAVSGIRDRSRVGFTNLTVPMNGLPVSLVSSTTLGREIEKNFLEGVRTLFGVLRLANNGVPSAAAIAEIQDRLVLAQGSFEVARSLAYGVEENAASATVIRDTGKITKKLTKLQTKVATSDAAAAGNAVVTTLTQKLLGPVENVLEAIPNLGDTRPLPAGFDLYTVGGYALVNNTGKPIDVNDVVIDVTKVTLTRMNEEQQLYEEAGTPFRVSYRDKDPYVYNDDPDNYADRVFPGSWLALTDYVYFTPPQGVVTVRLQGTITVDTVQYGPLVIPFELSW